MSKTLAYDLLPPGGGRKKELGGLKLVPEAPPPPEAAAIRRLRIKRTLAAMREAWVLRASASEQGDEGLAGQQEEAIVVCSDQGFDNQGERPAATVAVVVAVMAGSYVQGRDWNCKLISSHHQQSELKKVLISSMTSKKWLLLGRR